MSQHKDKSWTPFRPDAEDLKALTQDVSEIRDIQKKLLDNHKDLHFKLREVFR